MGIGTSMKETSLHYYRDPLVEAVSGRPGSQLRGIIIVDRRIRMRINICQRSGVGVSLECMRAGRSHFSCHAFAFNYYRTFTTVDKFPRRIETALILVFDTASL